MSYLEENRGYITHSKLKAFRFCQKLYEIKYVNEMLSEPESEALLFGSAFDLLVQGEEKFIQKFKAVDRRDAKSRGENPGKILLTRDQERTMFECLGEFRRQNLYRPGGENQVSISAEYRGFRIRGTFDKLFRDEKIIRDTKTTASAKGLATASYQDVPTLQYFKDQLSFYQFLVQLETDDLYSGEIEAVSKEDPPRSVFYRATAQSLLDNRASLITSLDQLIDCLRSGMFAGCERNKCLECEAYGVCPNAIQQEYIDL